MYNLPQSIQIVNSNSASYICATPNLLCKRQDVLDTAEQFPPLASCLEAYVVLWPTYGDCTAPVPVGCHKITLNMPPRARGGVQHRAEEDGQHHERATDDGSPIDDVINHIVAHVGTHGGHDPTVMVFVAASQKKYTISTDSFDEIPDADEPRRIAFVDGGSELLEEAPAFLIGMNRVYYSLFRGNKRQRPVMHPRMEFFTCLTSSAPTGHAVASDTPRNSTLGPARHRPTVHTPSAPAASRNLYSVKLFTHSPADRIRLPPDDELGITEEDIRKHGTSRVGLLGMPRKMAEWAVAESVVATELAAGDVLVMDGTLQSGSGRESAFAAKVYNRAVQKGVVVCGLAKTTTLTTVDNRPLVRHASEVAKAAGLEDRRWFARIGERATADDKAYTFIVKLHEKSEYAFRFGILAEQYWPMNRGEVESVLASVAANSRDIAMPGFPYGAIDADRFAKVRMREAAMYRDMLGAEMLRKPGGAEVAAQIRSMSAHQVLNRVTG